jgi:SAM-dependent methyltransferase
LSTHTTSVDTERLEHEVKAMYRDVADRPEGDYHFELGRELALRVGYAADLLDEIPEGAVESFAGVGHHFDLAGLREGEQVLDLGSGSGMDAFAAALQVGPSGRVVGIDMTPEQVAKADRLRRQRGLDNVEFRQGRIEQLPVPDDSVDVVISNGVINLSPYKAAVFAAVARVLRPGGRLALADIVSSREIEPRTVAKVELWAACIAGAVTDEEYLAAIETAGLTVQTVRDNPGYRFLTDRAATACSKYGVKSISLLAVKPR